MKKNKAKFPLIFILFFIFSVSLKAQNIKIHGKITDNETGEAIIGVPVGNARLGIGTVSSSPLGYYYLDVPFDTTTITVNYIGYEKKTIKLNSGIVKNSLDIVLLRSAINLEEISVTAEKEKIIRVNPDVVSAVSISPALIAKLPNFGEVDIMRAFQLLPGISGSNETSAGLYVRGGTPDQNLILFDGMSIYHVDHFYGFFSAFNANSVDDVELYKGGFPAEFGGRTSSILDIKGKPADMQNFNIGGGLSLLSVNAFAEIPIVKDKVSLQIAFRRSYTDLIKSGLYDNIFGMYNDAEPETATATGRAGRGGIQTETFEPSFYFYDLNTKLSYKPTNKDLFTLSFYNGKDNLDNSREQTIGFNPENTTDIKDILEWGNIGTSAGWQRNWKENFKSDLSLSYSNYFSLYDKKTNLTEGGTSNLRNINTYEDNNVKDFSLRLGNEWNISENNTLKFGSQITYNDISYEYIQSDTLDIIDKQNNGTQYAGYIQDQHTFFDKLKINAGFRATYFDATEKVYYEPRLSAILELPHNFKLKGATGLYYQFISRTVREDVLSGSKDFWMLADDVNVPVSSSIHYIAGIDWQPGKYFFGAEVFYKDMTGLSEYSMRFSGFRDDIQTDELFFQGTGVAKGFELLAQKKLGKVTGWLAYTYSDVIHDFPEINQGLPFYALHDQTHEFKAVYSQKIGNWDLSATWIYATGTPYTAPEGEYQLSLLDGTQYSYIHVSDKNSYRLPDYHRLDISGRYNFNIGKAKANIGLSIFNVYNHENIWYKSFETDEESGQLIETNITKLGFTPNLSFQIYLH